jgi:hypothetical protein
LPIFIDVDANTVLEEFSKYIEIVASSREPVVYVTLNLQSVGSSGSTLVIVTFGIEVMKT